MVLKSHGPGDFVKAKCTYCPDHDRASHDPDAHQFDRRMIDLVLRLR
jgi:hypothetical protein